MAKHDSPTGVKRETIEALEWGVSESPEFSEVERLMNEFQAHELQEEKFVQLYREVGKTSPNALVKFLLRLIIADEERHHALTHFMASSLKGDLNWTRQQEAIQGLYELESQAKELLNVTEDFIRFEREGIKEHQNLSKTSKRYHRGLFSLLCKSMIYDSKKHLEILQFLRAQLKQR